MRLFKIATKVVLSSAMLLTFSSGAFAQSPVIQETYEASVTLDGRTTHFSSAEVLQAANLNNVDPRALQEAIESGPDEDGRFSPFSRQAPSTIQ